MGRRATRHDTGSPLCRAMHATVPTSDEVARASSMGVHTFSVVPALFPVQFLAPSNVAPLAQIIRPPLDMRAHQDFRAAVGRGGNRYLVRKLNE